MNFVFFWWHLDVSSPKCTEMLPSWLYLQCVYARTQPLVARTLTWKTRKEETQTRKKNMPEIQFERTVLALFIFTEHVQNCIPDLICPWVTLEHSASKSTQSKSRSLASCKAPSPIYYEDPCWFVFCEHLSLKVKATHIYIYIHKYVYIYMYIYIYIYIYIYLAADGSQYTMQEHRANAGKIRAQHKTRDRCIIRSPCCRPTGWMYHVSQP